MLRRIASTMLAAVKLGKTIGPDLGSKPRLHTGHRKERSKCALIHMRLQQSHHLNPFKKRYVNRYCLQTM